MAVVLIMHWFVKSVFSKKLWLKGFGDNFLFSLASLCGIERWPTIYTYRKCQNVFAIPKAIMFNMVFKIIVTQKYMMMVFSSVKLQTLILICKLTPLFVRVSLLWHHMLNSQLLKELSLLYHSLSLLVIHSWKEDNLSSSQRQGSLNLETNEDRR